MRTSWAALFAIPTAVTCGDPGGKASVVTDSAGVEIVAYAGPDRPLLAEFTEELRLGGSETDPQQSFFNVSASSVGSDAESNIYVFDRDGSRIVVFDSRGRFLRSMGRSGEGPGEIGLGFALVVGPDGTAGVADVSKRGLVWFAPDGEPLPVQPMPPTYYGGMVTAASGAVIVPVHHTTSDDEITDALLRVQGADTTKVLVRPPNERKPVSFPSCGMSVSGMAPVFAPSLRWASNAIHVGAP